MKKFLLIFGLLLCSCTLPRSEYLCTITYSIDNISHTEEIRIITTSNSTPIYIQSNDMIAITAIPLIDHYNPYIVYKGSLPTKVENFEYKLIREFKVNGITGVELKE